MTVEGFTISRIRQAFLKVRQYKFLTTSFTKDVSTLNLAIGN